MVSSQDGCEAKRLMPRNNETTEEYLNRGGKITIVTPDDNPPRQYVKIKKKNWNTKDYDYSNLSYPVAMEY